ncbi:MAG: uroporphyrinogen decarboxylase family protein, partial [Bacteroidota bacterium]
AFFSLKEIGQLDCQVVGLDWSTPLDFAFQAVPDKALQGNMDPCLLYGTPENIRQATLNMMQAFPRGRHIVNLGHGIYPDLPRENVIEMIRTVKEFVY